MKKCANCPFLASGMGELREHWQMSHQDDYQKVQQFLNKDDILAPIPTEARPNATPNQSLPLDVWMKR